MFIYFSTSKLMTLVTNLSAYKKMKQTFLIKPNIRVHVCTCKVHSNPQVSNIYRHRISCTKAQYFLCIALPLKSATIYVKYHVYNSSLKSATKGAKNLLCIYPKCINIHPKGISDIRRQISGTYLLP